VGGGTLKRKGKEESSQICAGVGGKRKPLKKSEHFELLNLTGKF